MRDRWSKVVIPGVVNNHIVDYPAPLNISNVWAFGSLAGIMLVVQVVSGVWLAMHYCPKLELAFDSVEHIMRDVNNGWLLRYVHSNGASFFFIAVYCHLFRGVYYGSYIYPRGGLWVSGVLLFLLMIITAFIGYVLPYGQMSLWGATVITNLLSAIPLVGSEVVDWLLGGYSVDNATLNRFFSLHYLLPFGIIALVLVHLVLLHGVGSGNRLGIDSDVSKISFHPYCYVKDLFLFIVGFVCFSFMVFFKPNVLGHSDNYIMADSLDTPEHIVPEWYLLPFYAILRSVPHKLGGVVVMIGAILSLLILPALSRSEVRSSSFRVVSKRVVVFWGMLVLLLGWVGQMPVKSPYIELGQVLSLLYFVVLLFCLPLAGRIEVLLLRDDIDC